MSVTTDPGLIVYEQSESTLVEAAKSARGLKIAGVEDRAGYEAVHQSRMVLKNLRVAIEKQRKALKESALDWGRRVDAEAKRLTAIVEPTELALEAEQKRIDAEKERLRAEAAAAARAKLDDRVARFAALGVQVAPSAVQDLADAVFEEMVATAAAEHAARVERERLAEEARAFEQAAREQAEAESRRVEAARLAKERAAIEAERARQAEERRRLDAEAAKVRAEQAAAQAKLEAERAEFERARKAEAEDRAREQAQLEALEVPIRCATFADPASIPADVRAKMDADRARAVAEWDAEDEAEAIKAAKFWLARSETREELMLLDKAGQGGDFALGYLAGLKAERARRRA